MANTLLPEGPCGGCGLPLTRDERYNSYWDFDGKIALCDPCRTVESRKKCAGRGFHSTAKAAGSHECYDLECACGAKHHLHGGKRSVCEVMDTVWPIQVIPQ